MISFLKKDDEEGQKGGGFMGKGDIIFLLVIAVLVGGFLFYSKHAKSSAFAHHDACAQSLAAQRYAEARECLQEASDLHYTSDSLDSLSYVGLSLLEDLELQESEIFQRLESLLRKGDTTALLGQLPSPERVFHFLRTDQLEQLSAWRKMSSTTVGTPSTDP